MSLVASQTEPQPNNESVDLGNMAEVSQIPRITISAFWESDQVRQTLETAASDRRMSKAHVGVQSGGIPAAAEFYSSAPTPNLIIVESGLQGDGLLAELNRLADVCDSSTNVVVIGHHNDIAMYRQLISCGVAEYLVAPVKMADVMKAVTDIFCDDAKGPLGKMIAFIGAKGGCGSSTICHNVAWAISSSFSNEVVLADLDLPYGTANINLDQDPAQGIAEAVFSPDRVDEILLDRLLAKCAEHLSLLAAPSSLERTYDFEENAFNHVLEIAQKGVPNVLVDLPHSWNGWTRQVLAAADEVIITAAPELANLRNAKNLVDTIGDIRPNDGKPRLILNQVGVPKRPEIGVSDFSAALDVEPIAVIPFEPALFGTASNNGQMISEANAKDPIAEAFVSIAQVITGRAELKAEKKSPLGFLKKFRRSKSE